VAENPGVTRVDLHLHLLPGLDDGAPDEATALAHARRMVADGIHAATVTPHVGSPFFDVDPLAVAEHTAALQAALDREGLALELHAGGEVHPAGAADLTATQLGAIAHGPTGARWVLAEVPFAGIDEPFLDGLRAIAGRGFGVVIAHPERAAGLLSDGGLERLRPALNAGAVLQVNACSLMGRQGPEAQDAAHRLVRCGLAYVIASDGHPGHRDHTLADGEAAARAAGASAVHAAQLTRANPSFLLRHGLPAGRPAQHPAAISTASLSRARDAARRFSPPGRRRR
jgi:protein-tyrosine phosphatase